ncbi:MAG: hypothetical protein KGR18_09370 [Acidobacteria bacterium]|nr:hypothetical protein [Acidobacteriota bacterium]
MDIYARWLIGGTSPINGDVTATGWARWLDLNTYSLVLDAESIGRVGAVGTVTFSLQYQSGVPELSRVLAKRSVSTVSLVTTTGLGNPRRELPLVEYGFTGVTMTRFAHDGVSGQDRPTFAGAFSYTKVDIKQTSYDLRNGVKTGEQRASLDIAQAIFT